MALSARGLFVCLCLVFLSYSLAAPVCNPGGVRHDCCVGCSQSKCLATPGCCWGPITNNPHSTAEEGEVTTSEDLPQGIPWCYSSNPAVLGYKVAQVNSTSYGLEISLQLIQGGSFYGVDITPIHVSVYMETEKRLRVKIFDPNNKRWEVPGVVLTPPPHTKPAVTDYKFSYTTSPFGFAVTRVSTGEVLFNTTTPSLTNGFNGLVFEDQYLEISTQLPQQPYLYGLGERVLPLLLDASGHYYTFFATDIGTPVDTNLYGSHPFYMELRNGHAHGVFLLNSNGMDVYIGPSQLTYRVIGGILDFYIFVGPTPANVIEQYTEVIGRPFLPPYWALGWHQCRYGYHTLQEVETVVQKYAENKIPLDTMWTDIDYMYKYQDFTFDPDRFPLAEVQAFVSRLHSNDQQYVVITDCGINNSTTYPPWVNGLKHDVFVKDAQGRPFLGKVWPGTTAWPDFLNPNTAAYWTSAIEHFLQQVPIDGLWIDMNEVSNFCNGECTGETSSEEEGNENSLISTQSKKQKNLGGFNPNNPPYAINNRGAMVSLNTKTMAMDALHAGGILEYNAHNMYGYTEANATAHALRIVRGRRALVIGRSTFPGHGRNAGHWLGDNWSTWKDLYYSIPGILNFQLFGVALVGADICGFSGATTEELCARWTELGAFYPFARNHNDLGEPPQEPYTWPLVANISRVVLAARYSLLPYYYTLFFLAHTTGSTVARPLFFEFPRDPVCFSLDRQFLVGSWLMISPVLEQGATSVSVYFPPGHWYDFWNHTLITRGAPKRITLNTPIDKIQVHVRGGGIIPTQKPALTTRATRQNPYSLLVALDVLGQAAGELYLDDGDSLDSVEARRYTLIRYSCKVSRDNQGILLAHVIQNGYSQASRLTLDTITVMGVTAGPSSAILNGKSINFTYDSNAHTLTFRNINLTMASAFSLGWH